MRTDRQSLVLSVMAFDVLRSPSRILVALRSEGVSGLGRAVSEATADVQASADTTATQLADHAVGTIFIGDDDYPESLSDLRTPPPILFVLGNAALLQEASVGMCGSRDASSRGLDAARTSGHAVGRAGLAVVSGYARGVDTETHLAALAAGGSTVIVLAEGILHFRPKGPFQNFGVDSDRFVVLSQFPPRQPWSVGAAMTRNSVIAALGLVLVVIEARDKGGTLDAGLRALDLARPVLALDFADALPTGNRLLIERGAIPITTPRGLKAAIRATADAVHRGLPAGQQLALTM